MNCEQAKPVLLEYLLEETSAEERVDIGRHLEGCESCTEEIARLRQTVAVLVRGEASEEIPQHIRLVAEPVSWGTAFWRDSARLAFAGAGLLCLAIALLALFRTTVSYSGGNWEIAFGISPAATAGARGSAAVPTAAESLGLDRAAVLQLIAEAVAASEAKQQRDSAQLVQTVAQQVEQKRLLDLREMAESLRYFQAAQTMMWKEQMQSHQLVGALMRQTGSPASEKP